MLGVAVIIEVEGVILGNFVAQVHVGREAEHVAAHGGDEVALVEVEACVVRP